MAYKIDMVYTDNPYTDVITHYAKVLGISTILKMSDIADQNETEESLMDAENMISCIEGTLTWDVYDSFPKEVLIRSGFTGVALANALADKNSIPELKRKQVLQNMAAIGPELYEEKNNYYRMLAGLPPMGYKDVYLDDTISLPDEARIDRSVPVHLMSSSEIYILDNAGALEEMYQNDKENRSYVRHLTRKVTPYAARKATMFSPLYVPPIESTELSDEFKDRLEINRRYAIRTVYSEAYKFNSKYYDSFIAVFIIINTIIDMVSRVQEFIARKEIFDIRTCQYIFESYGVPFFAEIPYKYQVRMVKNLHTLLKYKSTKRCMVDICSLFGFDNIEIFKYYLLRTRNRLPGSDEYSFTGVERDDFDLKFVKIPIDKPMDEYIRDEAYHMNYDGITVGEATWDGGLDHDEVKRDHKKLDFNYTRTKYLSVDALYEMSKVCLHQSYFFNMLFDNVEVEELINVLVPAISTRTEINVADLFTFLDVISFKYLGVKDTILDTTSKILTVNGFDFNADTDQIAQLFGQFSYMRLKNGVSGDNLEFNQIVRAKEAFDNFMIPTGQIPTFGQMMTIFSNNLDIREILTMGMKNADNKRIYQLYKDVYDALMTLQLTTTHFADPDTGLLYRDDKGDATYTEYLKNQVPVLYDKITEIERIEDRNTRIQVYANIIDNAVYVLEEWIDSEKFNGIFHNIPLISIDSIRQYIKTVIDFYKSYKVHFLGVNTVYLFDDKWEGWVNITDDAMRNIIFWKEDTVELVDEISDQVSKITGKDKLFIKEKVYLNISHWILHNLADGYHILTKIGKQLNTIISSDQNMTVDEVHTILTQRFGDRTYADFIDLVEDRFVTMSKKDKVHLMDTFFFEKVARMLLFSEEPSIFDRPGDFWTKMDVDAHPHIKDMVPAYKNFFLKQDATGIIDLVHDRLTTLKAKDKLEVKDIYFLDKMSRMLIFSEDSSIGDSAEIHSSFVSAETIGVMDVIHTYVEQFIKEERLDIVNGIQKQLNSMQLNGKVDIKDSYFLCQLAMFVLNEDEYQIRDTAQSLVTSSPSDQSGVTDSEFYRTLFGKKDMSSVLDMIGSQINTILKKDKIDVRDLYVIESIDMLMTMHFGDKYSMSDAVGGIMSIYKPLDSVFIDDAAEVVSITD